MRVHQLKRDEIDYLKIALFYGTDDIPETTEAQRKIIEKAEYSTDIPDELVFDLFDGIEFVPEDFPM